MRTKLVVTCLVLLVVTVVGWYVLKQETKGRDDGVQHQVVTANNPSEPPAGNAIKHSTFIPVAPPVNGGNANVIASYSQEKSEWKGLNNTAIRSRKVELIPSLLDDVPEEKGGKLSLQLFDDVRIDAEVSSSFTNANGTISTTAVVEGSRFGRVFIAKSDNELRARITVPERGKLYAIHYNPTDGTHYSLELDLKAEQLDDVGEHPVAPVAQDDELIGDLELSAAPPMLSDESVASTVIDVMIVYSNDALTDSGSVANVDNLIALAIAYGNDALTNTDTGIVLNLVHSEQVSYDGSDDKGTDLTRLTSTSDGYIDNVHTLRFTYGADFVCLMVGDYTSDGGISWILTSTNGSPSYAFSIVTQPAMASYIPVHELGHNMGLSHAKDQNTQPGPTSWSVDAHGFGDTTAGWHWHPTPGASGYCSVMTYTSGAFFADGLDHVRVGLFSDPAITHMGMACGDAVDGDSARVLRAMKAVYAAYRDRSLASNTIVVDSPNGGEAWTAQSTYSIKWDSKDVTGNVKIELYENGGFHSTISASTLNDRIYEWTIPAGVSGTGFRIRITSVDNGNIYDESDADFTIDVPFYNEPLDSNPGYTITGDWEYGVPQSGNTTYGGPPSACTGTNIYDTNLDNVYFGTSYLTSTAIDCSGYTDIRLKCMAWISVTSASTASIQVSNDGSTWITLYSGSDLWQTQWTDHAYDISAIADGQSTVYIRWAIDHPSGSVRSGFSVDDIKLTGISTTPSISISDVTVTEGDSGPVSANFSLSLDRVSANAVTVNYATAGNTATSDVDFTAGSGTVTFAPGDTSETVTVLVQGDTNDEDEETFYVNLSSPTNATIADNQGVGTIADDDAAPTVTLNVDNSSIAEAGGVATVSATLSNATTQTVTVNLGYTGTASGSDYSASASSIVISSGTTGTATITATSDTIYEGSETVIVDITSVTNGTEYGDQQQTVTITDDLNADADGDGMPNGWEVANGLDPNADDSADDADGDGYSNLQEYLNGTDPQVSDPPAADPTADAGPDQAVAQGSDVTLNGLNSTDPDGVIDTYLWEQIAGSVVSLSDDTAASTAFIAPGNGYEALTFFLTVTDNDGLSHTDTCIVNVIAGQSEPPRADAGEDQIVSEGQAAIVLDGTGSFDPENGTPSAYLWEQTAGSSVVLSDTGDVSPTFTAPAAGTEVLAFTLTVTDNEGLKDSDQCLVNVTSGADNPPTADAGPDQNVEEGLTVTLDGTGSIDPEDGAPGAWLWTQTAGLPVTLSDPSAAAPSFVAPSVDAEGALLSFQLTVTDSAGLKSTDAVSVMVSDNEIIVNPTGSDSGSGGGGSCFLQSLTEKCFRSSITGKLKRMSFSR